MIEPPRSLVRLLGRGEGHVAEAFLARTRCSPAAPFLRWHDQTWSYAQALARASELAAFLHGRLEPPRPRVATYLANCPEAMWTWLAATFAGVVIVPINRRHRGLLLEDMLERSRAGVLVTDADGLETLPPAARASFRTVLLVGDAPPPAAGGGIVVPFEAARESRPLPPVSARPGDTACIIYTSGTTGRSKAVLVRHNQLVRGAARLVDGYELESSDVFHNWLPLYHIAGQLHMAMTAVICGGTVALLPTFSTSRFLDEVREYGCTVICGMASTVHFIWSLPPSPDDAALPLRVGIIGGIPAELHGPFEQRFAMKLGENYGMTEIDPITLPRPGHVPPRGSCGRASPDVEVRIIDVNGERAPAGVLGEIAVRPLVPHVLMAGYEGDEAATTAAMQDGCFRTGDFGVLDEWGNLYFKGRASHYIRRRGENVSASELEAVMLRHPAIAECAAVGVPSEVGEEEIKLVLVVREHATLSPESVHAFAQANLARFMVPRFVEIVAALPRGELGKVKVADLRHRSERTWDAAAHRPAEPRG